MMDKPFPSDSTGLIKLLKSADLHYDAAHVDLVEAASVLATIHGDTSLIDTARTILEPAAFRRAVLGECFHEPGPEELYQYVDPERAIMLCHVKASGLLVPFPVDLFTRHGFGIGATGGGKTTAVNHLIPQLARFANVWMFDNYKDEFASIINADASFLLLDKDNIAFNPFDVHAPLTPEFTAQLFVGVISKECGLMEASRGSMFAHSHKLMQSAADGLPPTLHDLLALVERTKPKGFGRAGLYRDSILTRLREFIHSAPDMYRYHRGVSIEDLSNRNVVFSVKDLMESHAAFFTMFHILLLFNWRMARGERCDTIKNIIIVDEAKHLAHDRSSSQQGVMPIEQVMGESRAAGIGLLLLDQRAVLDPSVFGNAQLQIAFRITSGDEAATIARHMGLNDDQRQALHTLRPGEAVIRIPTLDEPFIGVFPQPDASPQNIHTKGLVR